MVSDLSMLAAQAKCPTGAFGLAFARMMHDGHADCYAAVLSKIKLRAGLRLFEIGCGFGGHIAGLIGRGVVYSAVDHSQDMVDAALVNAPDAAIHCCDIADADIPQADAVISVNVVQWLDDPAEALAAVRRALVPGGVCVIGMPDATCPDLPDVREMACYDAEDLAALFHCAGYRRVAVDRITAHGRRYLVGSAVA